VLSIFILGMQVDANVVRQYKSIMVFVAVWLAAFHHIYIFYDHHRQQQ